jgi:hypothetical protein
MQVADNVVFLTTINHLWLKARLRDLKERKFGIKEIIIIETPKTFPQSGFQMGIFHLQRNYVGAITFTDWRTVAETAVKPIPPPSKDRGILGVIL